MPKTFRSFKTDLDWDSICESLAAEETKYLAVKHTGFKCKRPHVHAYIDEPHEEYAKRYKTYNKELREEDEHRGPFADGGKCDTDFPQYMVKEPDYANKIKARFGYTLEELAEYHEKSDEHRETLKESLRLYLQANMPTYDEPEGLHKKLKLLAMEYYLEKNICFPPNLKFMILSAMLQLQPTDPVKRYLTNFF